jgi:hypothetical protein
MKYFWHPGLSLILTFVSLVLFGPIALAQQPDRVGYVTALQGEATVLHEGSTQLEPLAPLSPLYPLDIIQTQAVSKIKLTFTDGTVLTLGEKSKLRITEFVYAPKQNTHTALFTISLGVFRAIVQKILPQSRFEVATTTAVAALRGTEWLGEVKPDSTAIAVLAGKVSVSHINPDIPGEVVLTEGMGTDVDKLQSPTAPKKWGKARIDALWKATKLP